MLLMGKSTISTGPFSIAFCKRLPEGIVDDTYPMMYPISQPNIRSAWAAWQAHGAQA